MLIYLEGQDQTRADMGRGGNHRGRGRGGRERRAPRDPRDPNGDVYRVDEHILNAQEHQGQNREGQGRG